MHDFTDVPLEECLRRDAARPEADGSARTHPPACTSGTWPGRHAAAARAAGPHRAARPLVHAPSTEPPEIVLVDIDGTVALSGSRSPYDMTRVGQDEPNQAVIAAVRAMHAAGYGVVFCSGRDARLPGPTPRRGWPGTSGVPYEGLHMRPSATTARTRSSSGRSSTREIRDRCRVVGVFDDREQVVRMWRSLGLTVFQVAEGDF